MTTKIEIPQKPAADLTDDEIRATTQYKDLAGTGAAEMLGEAYLLSTARTMIKKLQKSANSFILKNVIAAVFERADSRNVWGGEAGDKLTIFRDGKFKVSKGKGSRSRFGKDDYVKLIGSSKTVTVGNKADEEKRGEYTLHIESPIKSRSDVPFSLRMEQPNGDVMRYPAKISGNPRDDEADTVSDFLKRSQMGSTATPHARFKLHEDLAKLTSSDDADDDDGDEDEDFDAMLDE